MSARTSVIWTPDFLTYRLSEDHPLNPVRLDLMMQLARGLGVLDGVDLIEPSAATAEELTRVHTPEYQTAVKSAPEIPFGVGHGLGTEDNPIFFGMHEAASLIAGGSVAAAREIAEGRADRAVNLAGGLHHAMPNKAGGFCVYNDCSVAIAWLLDQGYERIAYVDVDVHHGDGVQETFYDDPRVLTISMHQHPLTLWPHTGWAGELGRGDGEGYAVNVSLPPGTGDAGWLRAFHAVVPSLLESFRPQVLVTDCGADTHSEDPLANLELSLDGQRAIYLALRELAETTAGGKWLVLGGGGYALYRVVPRSWTHLLGIALERDVDPDTTIPADWTAAASQLTRAPLPVSMTDGADPSFERWGGAFSDRVDSSILETRRAAFPLHGLEPDDPRD
ncbi:acetoin utilization protein AcuC [Pseudonocardia phyllosphaerae]|uniref:acetoin utilization protein AcuC n=1 Tax=Pseudonocardia phyllosphaerae TaxID=3390502 RepID=UPI003979913D